MVSRTIWFRIWLDIHAAEKEAGRLNDRDEARDAHCLVVGSSTASFRCFIVCMDHARAIKQTNGRTV